ncbi:MAG TPA: sulfatase-like hydrolase/transferase [Polyangia bacterium]|nr:sulfatase-like hydrolase/transferase [Polyangia bacterium]
MAATERGDQSLGRWSTAGIWGGVFAGVVDAASTIARGVGGLPIGKAGWLIALDAGVLAALGLVAGALVGLAARLRASRLRAGGGRWWVVLPEIAAAALALPLLVVDARAMFAGHKAAALPGHGLVSAALVVLGLVAVVFSTRRYRFRLEASAGGGAWLVLLAAACAAQAINLLVLVRLYAWFHGTLALVTVVLAIAAFRLRPGAGRRWRTRRVVALVALAGAAGWALAMLPRSQILRFAVHERTAIAGPLLGVLPAGLRGRTVPALPRSALAADHPPLPDGPHRRDANLLIVTIDALRADHVGAYGYSRAITPNIDALAAGATRFARAYAQAPHTSFSVTSMLTGKYFATLARVAPGEFHEPISSIVRTYGWRTAAFFPPAVFYIDSEKLKAYADNNFGFEYVKFEYLDAQRRVDQIIRYYDEVRPAKALVWVHFFEPHEPYQTHDGFDRGPGDIDRYDSEIAYVDDALGRLLTYVRARRPNTIVVLTADHGEEFDEHGGRYHGSTLYEEQLRVPLLVAVPGITPAVVAHPVQLVDVAPTLLNIVDIPVPARMRGTDLGPWLARPPAAEQWLPPAFAEVNDQRAVITPDEKLICDLRAGFCAYYDLAADPGERRNLADDRPARLAALRARLDDWIEDHVALEPLPVAERSPAGLDPPPRAIERGRLADVGAAGSLAALLASDAPLAARREAGRLLAALPAQPSTAAALAGAAADPDPEIAAWAAVGAARLGVAAARARVQALVAAPTTEPVLRARGALALLALPGADGAAFAVLGARLHPCDDVPLCRDIILAFGRARDRRAAPFLLAALPEVQNRRELVVALGEIGDRSARDALVDRLESDEYVPVRVEAARALAKLGDARVAPALERAARREGEPAVAAAAEEAARTLRGRRQPASAVDSRSQSR